MKKGIVAALIASVVLFAAPKENEPATFEDLQRKAKARRPADARVNLDAADVGALAHSELLEEGRVPNYLRALSSIPNAVKPMATLIKAAIYEGAVEPEIKLAMAMRIAQIHASPYTAVHIDRLLRSSPRGKALISDLAKAAPGSAESLAVRYADQLTRNIHGVSNADFAQVSSVFNDSQVVELTMTTCFFNYFTRMVEALNLPVEPWAVEPARLTVKSAYAKPSARVALVSDAQAEAVARALAQIKENQANPSGLGLGFANSLRTMLLSPAFGTAWRNYGTAVRQYEAVNRETKLQVSFAVSMANGCRYCTVHQVLGLKRLNVSPTKLLQMKKDDSALTPRELTAVRYARKLTAEPSSISKDDYEQLKKEFGDQGALEVTLQTCTFAFMNRFTDGLHLPSEDEAIRVYQEIYGSSF